MTTEQENKQFRKGDIVRLRAVNNEPGKGLDYAAQNVIALEDGCYGGWDVYDGKNSHGFEMSFYGFSVLDSRAK